MCLAQEVTSWVVVVGRIDSGKEGCGALREMKIFVPFEGLEEEEQEDEVVT